MCAPMDKNCPLLILYSFRNSRFKWGFQGDPNESRFYGNKKGFERTPDKLLQQFFKENEIIEFHHGDSIGADSQAHQIYLAVHPGKKVFLHPTTKDRGFNKAENLVEYSEEPNPLKRNERIVRICDLLLVCPKSIQQEARSGTWATYRYAMKLKKKVLVLI
jgi:hypothetical protein